MFDRRNNLSEQVAADVRSFLGDKVYETVIPRNVRVSEAPSHGKPVLLYDLRCAGSPGLHPARARAPAPRAAPAGGAVVTEPSSGDEAGVAAPRASAWGLSALLGAPATETCRNAAAGTARTGADRA